MGGDAVAGDLVVLVIGLVAVTAVCGVALAGALGAASDALWRLGEWWRTRP